MPTLIATYTSEAGGSERFLLDVARGLTEPPLIACPEGWLADQARTAGFTVFALPARSLRLRGSPRERGAAAARLVSHARELRELCDNLRPSLLVAWGMRTGIAAAAALRRTADRPPLVFQHVDFLPGPAIGRAVRAAADRADVVLCVSRAIADDLDPDGRLGERLTVLHCGVDLDRFHPADAGERPAADVLLLGALVPWKRPELALDAVALAARRLPDLRLRVAGAALDGEGERLLQRLRTRAAEPDLDGRVEFTGAIADPATAVREAACLIHCAEREPFGLVVAEALASGTPVVVPAAGGPAEIADTTCGALYPPGDAKAAAGALTEVMGRRDGLSAAARRRAESAFSLVQMQARYDELFKTTARAARAAPAGGDRIAFVTVTHNSEPELRRLAASIARHLPGERLVVVDNASADGSVTAARAAGATVIANDDNVGFGAAANAGVAVVTEPVTVLINPDVELVDASLIALARDVSPGQLLAPLVLNPDATRQDSAQPTPGSAATALYSVVPGALQPGSLRRRTEPWRARTPRAVGWATAACLVAQTETLRRLGPFDESIFLYAEDLDLGLRAETWFRPDARVVHTRAHSTAPAFGGEPFELLAQRRHEVVERRLGRSRAKLDDMIQMTTFADRRLLKRLLGRSAEREAAQLRALRAARKRVS